METITIKSTVKNYNVHFPNSDNDNEKLSTMFKEIYKNGDIMIVDSHIYSLLGYEGTGGGDMFENYKHIVIDSTEEQKDYYKLGELVDQILSEGFRKNNKLIAIGGGITQDIVSFLSSILFRGVDWVFFPTTLLSQGDSCIGGKTSINFSKFKNQLGGFCPPNDIYIYTLFTDSLSKLNVRSGVGEMLHFYLVSGEKEGFISNGRTGKNCWIKHDHDNITLNIDPFVPLQANTNYTLSLNGSSMQDNNFSENLKFLSKTKTSLFILVYSVML